MNREKIEQAEREVKTAQSQLDKALANLEEAKTSDDKWVPKRGETYWFISDLGYAIQDGGWTGLHSDQSRLAFNNVFPTKEKAEQARDVINGMCWEEFPEKSAVVEWVHEGKHRIDYWQGLPSQQAMFRMGTLRVKK